MEKKMSSSSFLILGVLLILIGLFTLIGNVNLFKDISNIMFFIMLLLSIKNLISFLLKKQKISLKLLSKISVVILSLVACIFKEYTITIVPITFSLYIIINSVANLMKFTLLKINKIKGGYSNLFVGIIYLLIGLIILFGPIIHLEFVLNVLGIYAILLGISFIFDYLNFNNYKKFPRIKIFLPFFIEAIIPFSVIQKINKKFLEKNNNKYELINKKDNDIKPDLEILIHVTENGYGKLGHMDICYNNEIISFGNYDVSNTKLNGIFGNGVLFIAKNRKKYIKFCIEDSKKTIFVFGLKLSLKQKEKINKNIRKIKEQLKPWNSPYVEAKLKNKNVNHNDYNDYSSRIYKHMKPEFYKFKTGRFKVFFILNNNCVSLANKIIGSALKDSLKLYGIITPGTYYDYLEREYMKKNSIVISKKIYNKYNMNKIS